MLSSVLVWGPVPWGQGLLCGPHAPAGPLRPCARSISQSLLQREETLRPVCGSPAGGRFCLAPLSRARGLLPGQDPGCTRDALRSRRGGSQRLAGASLPIASLVNVSDPTPSPFRPYSAGFLRSKLKTDPTCFSPHWHPLTFAFLHICKMYFLSFGCKK